MSLKSLFTASLAVLLTAPLASAQVININITSGNGNGTAPLTLNGTIASATVAPATYNGGNWNDLVNTPTGMDLIDSEGNATTIDVAFAAGANAANGGFSFSYAAGLDLLNNYMASNNGFGGEVDPGTITFGGLDSGSQWDIYFISQGDSAGQGSAFTIGATTLETTGSDPAAAAFIDGQNFVVFEDVFANGSGEITATIDDLAAGPNFQVLNGIQLVRAGTTVFDACDVNLDGSCNSTDFNTILGNLLGPGGRTDGDLNGDSTVDFADFRIFKDDALRVVGSSALASWAAVPEPTSIALLMFGSVAAVGIRRRR